MTIKELKKIKVGDIVAWHYIALTGVNNMTGVVSSVHVRGDHPYAYVRCFDGSDTTIGKLGMREWTILTE